MKTAVVGLACFVIVATAAPSDVPAESYDNPEAPAGVGADTNSSDTEAALATQEGAANATAPEAAAILEASAEVVPPASNGTDEVNATSPSLEEPVVSPEAEARGAVESAEASLPPAATKKDEEKVAPAVKTADDFKDVKKEAKKDKPGVNDIYSGDRSTPSKATSLSGDETDIDASVRERIEQDSKRIGKIAENLVGVQGDINRVEKEVLGKVFDMSSMKAFLNAHESAIKDHEKLDKEQDDLNKQATALSKQLDKAINETSSQDKKHRAAMTELSSKVAEDKAVIQGLQKELVPLVEMQKETEKLPPINANLTAQNTKAVAAAQAATEELVYEKSKLKTYQDTTKNLMKELVKQHDYAQKCRERLYELNTQLHEIDTKEAKLKYEQGKASAQGEAMEKALEEKNKLIETRLKKAKTNLQTINFAKSNVHGKIVALQSEGQLQLEKLKDELGKLRQQSASIEAAMMAKISNRKLIEKALRGASVQMEDLQAKLLAGKLDKLRRNNTQMTGDLAQIREGLQSAQINTAKAEAKRTQLLAQAAQIREQAMNKTQETQEVARKALAQVVAAKQSDDDAQNKAQEAVMEAQASALVKCDALWWKEHDAVKKKLEKCKEIKQDLQTTRASVAALTSSVKAGGPGGPR